MLQERHVRLPAWPESCDCDMSCEHRTRQQGTQNERGLKNRSRLGEPPEETHQMNGPCSSDPRTQGKEAARPPSCGHRWTPQRNRFPWLCRTVLCQSSQLYLDIMTVVVVVVEGCAVYMFVPFVHVCAVCPWTLVHCKNTVCIYVSDRGTVSVGCTLYVS
ncbi:uncharacterized protein LOC143293706 isoform X2 [Babylonia areolata]|uniref:uncharacterized protein LOC143293706 isoform X2 n=1 Tax=Babylonia areolata TaxID=304850 RepID=UPI003FD50EE5